MLRLAPQPENRPRPASNIHRSVRKWPGEGPGKDTRPMCRPGATAPSKIMLSTVIILSALVIVVSFDSSEP